MHSLCCTPTCSRRQPAERNAFCTLERSPVRIRRALNCVPCPTMKYGKYNLNKSTANLSIGTSYSWYYRKSDRREKNLLRATSDSTLFSDYTNQIGLFEKDDKANKKCKKQPSDVSKQRIKCPTRNIKPVRMEPFIGNFFYGKSLPGYDDAEKTEEKITYLPDSDIITVSEDTNGSVTSAPTVIGGDIPDLIKNPIYGCLETEVRIVTPDSEPDDRLSDSNVSRDTQLQSNSCTELQKTLDTTTETEDVLGNILNDYKRIMKEWNKSIEDHFSDIRSSKTSCRTSNADSYVKSLHSTLSCRKKKHFKYRGKLDYKFLHSQRSGRRQNSETKSRNSKIKTRRSEVNKWRSTINNLKRKLDISGSLSPSECECLEAVYEDYDRRLQQWCDTISQCSSNLVLNLLTYYLLNITLRLIASIFYSSWL